MSKHIYRLLLKSRSQFDYNELDHGSASLRLLRVMPRPKHGLIQCSLRDHILPAKYLALSYTWGRPQSNHYKILLNGKLFIVRQNLYDFLKHAVLLCPNQDLWIDAVCIDQSNVPEETHQVQQMARIYLEAEKVLVWLGNDPDLALRFQIILRYFPILSAENDPRPHFRAMVTAPGSDLEAVFQRLYHNPYWDRMWVIQELLLAGEVDLVCCNQTLPYGVFASISYYTALTASRSRRAPF